MSQPQPSRYHAETRALLGPLANALANREAVTEARSLGPGSLVPGTRYRIVRWIGEGGMGVVYEAEHLDLQRRVALKVLRPELTADPRVAGRFLREARAACQVQSPHVVQVLDYAELPDGRSMFTMELLEGTTLVDVLAQDALDPARTIAILRQACKGLAAAHAAGIVHRDVKPENIALTRAQRRRDAVKILDFGIHLAVEKSGAASGQVAGSPSYMSPEMISGVPIDHRSDVYSLGCTAFEMLSGRPPFIHAQVEDLLWAHFDEVPPSLTELAPHVPPALARVVLRCLAKKPADRYADMDDLEAALCEAQVAARLQTTWDDLPLPDIDPERRDQLLASMPDPAKAAAPKRRWLPWLLIVLLVVSGVALALSLRTPDTAASGEVDGLAQQAHAAAARAFFVYPPADDPGFPTAYRTVLALEERGSEGRERAADLRSEFADTLTRLGDHYWDEPGGRAFAIDFYAEAIMFDPDRDRAAERATLTPGQLANLQRKAATLEFTPEELVVAEPLAALAEDDPAKRDRKLQALQQSSDARPPSVEAQLARLTRKHKTEASARGPSVAAAAVAVPIELGGDDEPAAVVDDEPAIDEPEAEQSQPRDRRDPAEARRLARSGRAALQAGRYADARRSFEAALAADPRNAAALGGLAEVHFHLGQYGLCARYGRRATNADPRNARTRMVLGDAYYKIFRYRDALAEYREADALGHPGAARAIAKVEARLAER